MPAQRMCVSAGPHAALVIGDSGTHGPYYAPWSFVTVPAHYEGAQRVPELLRVLVLSGRVPGAGGRATHSGSAVRILQQPCLPCTGS